MDEFATHPARETETVTYEPGTVSVSVGRLVIVSPAGAGKGTGVGTRLFIDGVELTEVHSATLTIRPDAPLTLTVEQYV